MSPLASRSVCTNLRHSQRLELSRSSVPSSKMESRSLVSSNPSLNHQLSTRFTVSKLSLKVFPLTFMVTVNNITWTLLWPTSRSVSVLLSRCDPINAARLTNRAPKPVGCIELYGLPQTTRLHSGTSASAPLGCSRRISRRGHR